VILNGRLSPLLQIGTGFRNEFTAKDNIIANGMLLGYSKPIIEKKVDSIINMPNLKNFLI
jgi:ABC-type polysaccharide/polyol phosphate transport system ATPase subunit